MTPHADTVAWSVLVGVLVALTVFFILNRRNKAGKIPRRSAFLYSVLSVATFLVAAAGVWLSFLWSSGAPQDTSAVRFPETGSGPISPFIHALESIRPTPEEILITLFLLVPITFLMVNAFRSIAVRKKIEKDLEDAKTAALNVLEDLQVEKETLAATVAKDEALLESIGDGVIAVDEHMHIILMNSRALAMLGRDLPEVIGKKFSDIVTIHAAQDETSAEVRPVSVSLMDGKTSPLISDPAYQYTRKDGTRFPVAIKITPVVVAGQVIGAIQVFRDVTKEKEIDRAKSEFVSLASHQLRTPLTTINWYSEMLLGDMVGRGATRRKEYLEKIHAGSQRMVTLVNALLNVSRIELGTLVVESKPVRATELLQEVVQEQRPQIAEKGITVTEDFPQDAVEIWTDPNLLRMIFQNLLSNAIKYTPPAGHIDLSSSVARDTVSIVFSDTGYGIPKKDYNKIFTKMFRADNVKEKGVEGTGLGLYIVQSVLAALGGSIRFESKENVGTRFFVSLPLKT